MAIDSQDLADDPTPEGQQQPPPGPSHHTNDPDYRTWLAVPINAHHSQELRRENAAHRVKNRTLTEQLKGLDPDGTGRASLSGVHQELRQLKVDNMVLSTAHKQGVSDLRRLRFELSESDALKTLDPSDAHFAEDVDSLIGELVVQVPELKSGGRQSFPPQGTGAQFRPGPTSTQISRSDLANMTPEEIDAARRSGKLNAILGRS
jgi:hypothetical protein